MKKELENTKPKQSPGQNVADMSLGVTYHCQALSTCGIWDPCRAPAHPLGLEGYPGR